MLMLFLSQLYVCNSMNFSPCFYRALSSLQCFSPFKSNDKYFEDYLSNSMASLLFQLTSMDDLEQDLVLMFDNACRYNEPDSQVYKVGFLNA